MPQNNNSPISTSPTPISLAKALLVGHLVVSLPELLIMLGFIVAGRVLLDAQYYLLFIIAGFVLAWLWWAFFTPRWQRWALKRGAPAVELQRWARITGIPWPKRPIFNQPDEKSK